MREIHQANIIKYILKVVFFIIIIILSMLLYVPCTSALPPPTKEEIEKYKQDGTLEDRIKFAQDLGTDQVDPSLFKNYKARMENLLSLEPKSAMPAFLINDMPSTGTVRLPVLIVDFSDAPSTLTMTTEQIQSQLFNPEDVGSLTTFYKTSSYNLLNIKGDVLGVYRAQHPLSYYKQLAVQYDGAVARQTLAKEVFAYYDSKGYDFSQYDSNNDNYMDSFYILWSGPTSGWGSTWYTYKARWWDASYTIDGKSLKNFVMYNINSTAIDTTALIHETGHLLGLPDYYSYDLYDEYDAPNGGLGGFDIMDANSGDHNIFSKFLLGWVTPKVVRSGSTSITLGQIPLNPDGVLLMPTWNNSIFSEYFMVEYLSNVGNYRGFGILAPGVRIFHVDARVDEYEYGFLYNNSYTDHKLLRVMEADGLESIEKDGSFGDEDLYRTGSKFSPDTFPNSDGYGGAFTGINIDEISTGDSTASLRVNFTQTQNVSKVIRNYPQDGQKGIEKSVKIQITFDNTIYAGDNLSSITLRDKYNNNISYTTRFQNNILFIMPENNLRDLMQYTVTIPANSIRNALGLSMNNDMTIHFTTASGATDKFSNERVIPGVSYITVIAADQMPDGDYVIAYSGRDSNSIYSLVYGMARLNSQGELIAYKTYDLAAFMDIAAIYIITIGRPIYINPAICIVRRICISVDTYPRTIYHQAGKLYAPWIKYNIRLPFKAAIRQELDNSGILWP